MLNVTNITPPRVPLTDARTGLISREWYRFFLNLFDLTGNGTSDFSLTDLQIGPPTSPEAFEEINRIYNATLLNNQPVQLGTLSSVNQDNVGYLRFSNYPSPTPGTQAGTMSWNDTGGLDMHMGIPGDNTGASNITQQVGEEIYVYGKASAAINDSPLQAVRKTGTVGASGTITFAPTIAGLTDPGAIIGVATEPIANNSFGRVTAFGVVRNITTNGTAYGEVWADNDDIWYNPTTGGLTKTKPPAPGVKIQIGTVINAGSGGSGSFQVLLLPGSVLGGTDSNVEFSSLANNDLISYDSALGYWKNVTAGSVPFGITAGQIVYGSATGSLTSSSNFTVSGTTMTVANATVQTALKVSSLTSGRVPIVTTSGQITDNLNLTFDTVTNTLTAANATVQTALKVSALTSGRVTLATTSGQLTDDADLTFNTSTNTLTATNAVVSNSLTVDTDTLVVDPVNNYVGIGRSAPAVKLDIYDAGAASARVISDTIAQGFIVLSYVAGTGAGTNSMYKSRGTFASPTGVVSGDQSGLFRFYALDSTGGTDREIARMTAFVGTASGADNISGRVVFWTRPTGAGGTLTQRVSVEADGQLNALFAMRVDGNVGFYGTTPAAQPTAVGNVAVTAAGATNTVFRNTTFTGGTGTTAYTIGDIVRALKLLGLITS